MWKLKSYGVTFILGLLCVFGNFSSEAAESTTDLNRMTAASFRLTYPTRAHYCAPVPMMLQALTENGEIASDYVGSVTLSMGHNAGSWQLANGHGTLTAGINDGTAVYQFDSRDAGIAQFSLTHRSHSPTIMPSVFQSNDVHVKSDPTKNASIQFVNAGFVVSGREKSFDNLETMDIITAGDTFRLYLRAMQANDGACSVLDLNDTITIMPSLEYIDPIKPPIPSTIKTANGATAASGIAAKFEHGVAVIDLSYDDVGLIRVNLSAGSHGAVEGASPLLAFFPASLRITRAEVVDELDTTSILIHDQEGLEIFDAEKVPTVPAGKKLRVSVMPQNLRGKFTPSFGKESTPAKLILHTSLHPSLAPWGRNGRHNNGVLRNGEKFDYSNGDNLYGYTNHQVAYEEVGLTVLTPALVGGKYLGLDASVVRQMPETIGRFTPAYFSVQDSAPKLTAACPAGHFSYIGQPILFDHVPLLKIYPKTVDGKGLNNYQHRYCRLCPQAPAKTSTLYYEQGNPGKRVSPYAPVADGYVHVNSGNNCAKDSKQDCDHFVYDKLIFSGVQFAFNRHTVQFDVDMFDDTAILKESEVPPFQGKIEIYATIQDTDGIGYNAPDKRYDVKVPFKQPQDNMIYQGRLLLHPSETFKAENPLEVRASLQYFDGKQFVLNVKDTCTAGALDWNHWHLLPKGHPVQEGSVLVLKVPGDHEIFENATQSMLLKFPAGTQNAMHLTVPLHEKYHFLGYPWIANAATGSMDPQARASVGLAAPKGLIFNPGKPGAPTR